MHHRLNIHFLIIAAIALIVCVPIRYQKFVFWIPAAIALQWLILGNCIFNIHNNNNPDGDLYKFYVRVYPNITKKQAAHLTQFLTVLIPTIVLYRVLRTQRLDPTSHSGGDRAEPTQMLGLQS